MYQARDTSHLRVCEKRGSSLNSVCDSTSGADSDNDESAFTLDNGNIGAMITVRLGGVPVEALIVFCARTNVKEMRRAEIPKQPNNPRNAFGSCIVIDFVNL